MIAAILSAIVLAQAGAPAPAAMAPAPIEAGPCLDSPRPVPRVLVAPVTQKMQIVRIDKVESTATMMPGEVIGFLYTLQDGTTWLGQRTQPYVSPAGAAAINAVLSSTHMPGQNVSAFPPQTKYGVATKYQQFFRVQIVPDAMAALRIQLAPCVAWPAGRALPDPSM